MGTQDYTLELGASITPTLGPAATVIEQAIQQAIPNSYRGMIIYTADESVAPATTGAYAWQARCLWVPHSTGKVYEFDGATWTLIKATLDTGTVTNAMIADKTIQVGKLSATGANGLDILRAKATPSNGVEWIALAAAIINGTITLNKLVGGGAGVLYLKSTAGVLTWSLLDSAALIDIFVTGGGFWPLTTLETGTDKQVLAMSGTHLMYQSLIGLITDGLIPLAKITASPSNAGKYFRYNVTTGIPEAVTITVPVSPNIARVTNEILLLPACGVISISVAHGLVGIPQLITYMFVCVSTNLSYAVGDVIPLSAIKLDSGAGSADHGDAFTPYLDATNVTIIGAIGTAAANRQAPDKLTGIVGILDASKWKLRYTAVYFS